MTGKGESLFLTAHNPKVVSSNLTPATNFIGIHKDLLGSTDKSFFFLGKIGERNHSFLCDFRLSGSEKFTKLFCCVSLILRESVRVIFRHAVPAMTETLLANLLRYAERVHCCCIRVTKRVQPDRCSAFFAPSFRNLQAFKQRVQFSLEHVACIPGFPSRSLEQEASVLSSRYSFNWLQ
jgi:hypothetical protein